jgi:hypothetical protein
MTKLTGSRITSTKAFFVFSNIDCFHPSTLAHEWLSKMLWNMMFMQPNEKTATLQFDANAQIYCPNAADRIQTL